jgi:uncharacterized protein (TIGR00251 family)
MVDLQPHREGVILPVRARAGARQSGVRGAAGGALKVSVTTAAEKGKANKAIIAVLSEQLRVPKSRIQMLSGAAAPLKRFLIRDIALEELDSRIRQVLPHASP